MFLRLFGDANFMKLSDRPFNPVILTQMPVIFSNVYGQPPEIAGLQYIALGIGLSLASLVNAFFVDRIYLFLKIQNEGVDEPEYRLR
jgi:hypothetical protein